MGRECEDVDLLRKECEQLRLQLAQCISTCNSFKNLKELLSVIRSLENKLEALVKENTQLREKLKECQEARNN